MGSCVSATDIEDALEGHCGEHDHHSSWAMKYYVYDSATNQLILRDKEVRTDLVAAVEKEYAAESWGLFGINQELLHNCLQTALRKLTTLALEKMTRNHYNKPTDKTALIQYKEHSKEITFAEYADMLYKEMTYGHERTNFLYNISADLYFRWANTVTQKLIDDFAWECKRKDAEREKERKKWKEFWDRCDRQRQEAERWREIYWEKQHAATKATPPTTSSPCSEPISSITSYDEPVLSSASTWHAYEPTPTYEPSYQQSYPNNASDAPGWINPASCNGGTYIGGDPYSNASYDWTKYNENATTILSI